MIFPPSKVFIFMFSFCRNMNAWNRRIPILRGRLENSQRTWKTWVKLWRTMNRYVHTYAARWTLWLCPEWQMPCPAACRGDHYCLEINQDFTSPTNGIQQIFFLSRVSWSPTPDRYKRHQLMHSIFINMSLNVICFQYKWCNYLVSAFCSPFTAQLGLREGEAA